MKSKRLVFLCVATVIFLMTTIAATIVTLVLPQVYAGTARIRVESIESGEFTHRDFSSQKDVDAIRSEAILDLVAGQLGLNAKWGQEFNGGEKLKTAETRAILKSHIELRQERNTSIFEIRVYSTRKEEAAAIANALAAVYQEYCRNRSAKAQQELGNGAAASEALKKLGAIPKIEIIDYAKPGLRPVRPNVPLNIFLGAVIGVFAGVLLGGVAAFFAGKLARKRQASDKWAA